MIAVRRGAGLASHWAKTVTRRQVVTFCGQRGPINDGLGLAKDGDFFCVDAATCERCRKARLRLGV